MFGEMVVFFVIFVLFGLPIICITILIGMRLNRGGMKKRDRAQWEEETRLMQEMHESLAKMEARIESLETILLEDVGKDKR
jgi:phage shock protein B